MARRKTQPNILGDYRLASRIEWLEEGRVHVQDDLNAAVRMMEKATAQAERRLSRAQKRIEKLRDGWDPPKPLYARDFAYGRARGPGPWGLRDVDLHRAWSLYMQGIMASQRVVQLLRRRQLARRRKITWTMLKIEWARLGYPIESEVNRNSIRADCYAMLHEWWKQTGIPAQAIIWACYKFAEENNLDFREYIIEHKGMLPRASKKKWGLRLLDALEKEHEWKQRSKKHIENERSDLNLGDIKPEEDTDVNERT